MTVGLWPLVRRLRGHTPGITPAQFSAMVEGRRFANQNLLELVQFAVYHILSPHMDKGTSISAFWGWKENGKEIDEEDLAERRKAAAKLWKKIQTAQIASREVVGTFAGRGK